MKKIKSLLSVLCLILTIVIVFSCGKKENQETGTTDGQKQEQKSENTISGEVKNQQEKKGDKQNELGIQEGLPKDFPSDVPQPKNAKVLGNLSTSDGTVVTFESTDKPKIILDFYNTEMEKGSFKKDDGEMMSDNGGLTLWKKDKREISLMLAWDKDKNVCSVVITYK